MLQTDSPVVLVPHTFFYASSTASSVYVAGEFNAWLNPVEGHISMNDKYALRRNDKDRHLWELTLDLPIGTHEYKYVIDGHRWENDPFQLESSVSGNSCLTLTLTQATDVHNNVIRGSEGGMQYVLACRDNKVIFILKPGVRTLDDVCLAGSFNSWLKTTADGRVDGELSASWQLNRVGDSWQFEIDKDEVDGGEFKFVLNNGREWYPECNVPCDVAKLQSQVGSTYGRYGFFAGVVSVSPQSEVERDLLLANPAYGGRAYKIVK